MRVFVFVSLVSGLVAGAGAPAAGHAPFEPLASSPDHAVTMTAMLGGKKQSRIVTHHGEWSRVETEQDGRRTSEYFKRNEATIVRLNRGGANEYSSVSVVRGPERYSNWDYDPVRKEERQTFLGESCTVWEVLRGRDSGRGGPSARTSCVTDDGIELWFRFASGSYVVSSAEATRVERRPVAPAEAQPPNDLLALDWWKPEDQRRPANATPPEFETIMERSGSSPAQKLIRTVRQHSGWLFTEDMFSNLRSTLKIEHAGRRLTLHFRVDEKGQPKELIFLRAPTLDSGTPLNDAMATKPLGQRETILGEACEWFNMMPGVMDAGLTSCRTHDGISLKEVHSGYGGGGSTFVAVRFMRRPVALREVMPPKELLSPKTWDLPE
jgi:hypothetical protein